MPSKNHIYLPNLNDDDIQARIFSDVLTIEPDEAGFLLFACERATLELTLQHMDDQANLLAHFKAKNHIDFLNMTPVSQRKWARAQNCTFLLTLLGTSLVTIWRRRRLSGILLFILEGIMNKRMGKGHILINLALAAVSLCLTLIMVELVLRSIIPLNPRNPAEFRIPHPVLGWALKPDASYIYQMPEDVISVTYNSKGWRDIEHTIAKPDGTFRILILGDSFMEAYSVELNAAFPRRVEELARASGHNVEVINTGVGGYGTLQEYLVYRDIGQLYKPDLVLLSFFVANDVLNNSSELESMLGPERPHRRARPFLDLNDPTRWTIVPGDFEWTQSRYREEQAYLAAQRSRLTDRVMISRLTLAAIDRITKLGFQDGHENKPAADRVREELALLGINYCTEPAVYSTAWDTTERILARLKSEVEAAGSKLVVFTVPALEEVSADHKNRAIADAIDTDRLCLEEAPGHTRLGRVLKELDIELIPLLPEFRRVMREDGVQLYRLSDEHWNREGHALAAEQVVSELIKRQLLPIEQQ